METGVRPAWLVRTAGALLLAAAFCFTRGWGLAAVGLALAATPLDLIAQRLASLRLKPLAPSMLARRLLWPFAGLALLALGWFETWHGSGWGAIMSALAAVGFAEALRVERSGLAMSGGEWLLSWRNAIWLLLPFAAMGWWSLYLGLVALYAATSFFIVQQFRHGADRN